MENIPETTGENWRDEHGRLMEGHPPMGGRPKGSLSITAEIKRKLEEVPKGKKKSALSSLVDVILEKALVQKDEKTIRMIWNYVDGQPKAKMDLDLGQREDMGELTQFFRGMAKPDKA